jgi:EAL domain-containing protein (putative c-di-GMP-specific phosphodiesterase class I)
MESRLRRALAADELHLHFPPVFGLRSGSLVAVEALLRWDDVAPEPTELVRRAARTGLGEALTAWPLAAGRAQQGAWAADGLRPHITFNVAPRRLPLVHERLAAGGGDVERLTVDVTDLAPGEQAVHDLHALGVKIALDDFGTGSLAGLADLPVTSLKLDRSFLAPGAEAVLSALLGLARALGRTAVAKGVETDAQYELLVREGCPMAQGFLLGSPVAPEALEALMAAPLPMVKACAPPSSSPV